MSFDVEEYIKERRKKQTSNTATTDKQSFDVEKYIKQRRAPEVAEVISSRFRGWLEDYDSIAKNYSSRYTDVDNTVYRTDSEDWLSQISSSSKSHRQAGLEIKNMVDQYKDYLDPDWVSSFYDTFSNVDKYESEMLSTAQKENEYWSQWSGEEEYNSWYDNTTYGKKYEGMTYADIQKALGSTEGRENAWLTSNADSFMGSRDAQAEIDKIEKQLSALNNQENEIAWGHNPNGVTLEDLQAQRSELQSRKSTLEGIRDTKKRTEAVEEFEQHLPDAYEWYSNWNGARMPSTDIKSLNKGMMYKDSEKGAPLLPIADARNGEYMNMDEKILSAYLNTHPEIGDVDKYIDAIQVELDKRSQEETNEFFSERLDNGAFLEKLAYQIASVGSTLAGGIPAIVEDTYNTVTGKPINPYSPAHALQNMGQTIRSETAENIEEATDWEIGGYNVASSLYSFGMSAVDSYVGGKMFKNAYLLLAGTSAASSKMSELYERGASNQQVFIGGITSGIAEAAIEKIPLDNLLSPKSSSTFLQGLKEVAKQAGLEGLEEGLTESANLLFDEAIMGENSKLSLTIKKYESGYYDENGVWHDPISTEEAAKKAYTEVLGEIIYATVGGMISGGMISGPSIGIQTVHNSNALTNKGMDIIKSTSGYDALKSLANEVSSEGLVKNEGNIKNLVAKTQTGVDAITEGKASKRQERKTAKQVGKLSQTVETVRNEQNLAEIQSSLESKGLSKSKAKVAAKLLNEALYTDGAYSKELYESVMNDEGVWETLRELVSSPDSTLKSRNLKHQLGRMGLKVGKDGAITSSVEAGETEDNFVDEDLSFVKDASKREYEASVDGKSIDNSTGKAIDIVEVASIKNGQMMLKVKDADGTESVVNARDVSYASESEALVYEAVAHMGLDAVSANSIVQSYTPNQNAEAFALGVQEAYRYGRYNYSEYEMYQDGNFLTELSEEQVQRAYKLGQIRSGSDTAVAVARLKEAIANSKGKKGEGKIHYEGDAVAIDEENLNDRQKTGLKTMEMLSKALGIDFYVYASYQNKDGKRVYKNAQGVEESAPNGWYAPDGSIHIDLNAGNKGEGTILFTVAHELTHFIKAWSPAKFKVLANFLVEQYGKKGVSVETLVRNRMEKMRAKGRKNVTYDLAFEEFVADSMQTMLTSGNVMESLAEIKRRDEGLWNKIKEFFTNLVEHLKETVKAYSRFAPDTVEGRTVAEMTDVIEQFEKLFTEGLVDASNTYMAISEENRVLDAFGKDLGKVEKNANGDLLIAQNKEGTTLVYSERTYNEGGRDKLEAALRSNGHTDAEINETLKYLDDALDYLKILSAGYAKQNYTKLGDHLAATITTDIKNGKQVLSTLVNNGDYPVNLDLALICKKRVAYMNLMNRLIADGVFGKVKYDGDAIAEVNKILRDNEFETACLGCFVEARRLQFQTWAETIVTEWNDEVDKRAKKADKFSFAKDKNSKLTDADIDALTSELESGGKKNKKGNINLGQGSVKAKMGRLLDKVPSLRKHLTVDDLLTPEGLTALRSFDDNLFSLVKQRYGAASPKIVQDFNPYASEIADLTFKFVSNITGNAIKGAQGYIAEAKKELGPAPTMMKGESKADFNKRKAEYNDKAENLAMRNYLYAIGGARIQSFSDFMVENVFDYLQIFADLSAKRLPMHGYTKEIACLRLFGMTGAKWNGSLIAHVNPELGKEYAGLTKKSDGSYTIEFDDYARHKAKGSFIQSIGHKDIISLMLDPRYAPYVGNITIGVSDKQILMMLDSPLYRMIIPYHASGMLPQFAQLVGVDYYNDYTNYQNTTVKKYFDLNGNPVESLKNAKGEDVKPDTHFDFNAEVQKTKNPKQAAKNYIEWCGKQHPVYDGKTLVGYATFNPKFSDSPFGTDFSKHENYYKLLEDFNLYDNVTEEVAMQGDVTMTFPSEANRLSAEQMAKYKDALRETGLFTEREIEKYAKKADMTFEEIVKAEFDNRVAYDNAQAPKWEGTVSNIERMLLDKYGRDEASVPAKGTYEADDGYRNSDRGYSYEALTSKPDMTLTSVDDSVKRNRADIVYYALQNAVSVGHTNQNGNAVVYVDDIATEVIVPKKSLVHGLDRRTDAQAPVLVKIGEILKNSIRINELTPRADETSNTYVLVGAAVSQDGNPYIASFVVNQYSNEVSEIDVLYSANAKKESAAFLPKITGNSATPTNSKVSIAQLLDFVNNNFPDILPESVLRHFGHTERPAGKIGESALFSDRDSDSVSNRALLANALESTVTNEIERKTLDEYKEELATADALERELAEIRSKIKELSFAKGPKDTEGLRKLREQERKTINRIDVRDKKLLRLEATKPLKDIIKREKEKAYKRAEQKGKEALARHREKSAETQRELLNRWKESRKEAVENRHKSEIRTKIKNFKKKLEGMLQHPTDRQYVPHGLANAMIEVCELINTDTPLYKRDGSINKAQERRDLIKARLNDLKNEYEKLKKHTDPMYSGEFDETIYEYLTELQENFGGKNLNDMTLDELREMYETLRAIEETLRDARKLIGFGDAADVYEAGDAIASEQAEITKSRKNGKRNSAQKTRDKTLNYTLSPMRNVERMSAYNEDSFFVKLFKKLEQGIRKKNKFAMESYKLFEALTTGENAKTYEDAMYKEVGEKKYTDINGRTFGISKMQMMQTILSYEREVANGMHHIEGSGFSFADLDMLRKGKLKDAVSEEYSHRIPSAVAMVEAFKEELKGDKWAQDYMEVARKFFNEKAKDAINETMLALKHRIIAKDKNYIPFEVDKNFVVREISAQNDIQQTINSYGMLKETKVGASQPLIITGLNNILDRHIDQVGNVYGLAIEVRNFNKVWNVRTMDSVGSDPTVKTAIQRNWGIEGVKHIEQAVQDIQGSRPNEQSAFYRKVKSNYIGATFLLNLSVVTKQIGSLFTSTSMLRYRSPIRMMGNLVYTMVNYKKIAAEVDKYTATAWVRRQGVSDSELQTLLTEGKKTLLGKLLNKLPTAINPTKWIQGMDSAVALSLWKYAKQDVAKKNPTLKGEELLKATAEFYDDVVENTQSMTDVLHRPEVQKKGDLISDALGMFKTDLYQMAGQLQVTAGRYSANKSSENGKALLRTASSVVMSAVWGQLMTTVFALLRYKVNHYRDEEDEELTAESWLKRQSFAFAGDLVGYIFPLLGSEAVGVLENIIYGESEDAVDNIALTAINDAVDAFYTVASSVRDGEMPSVADSQKLVTKALQLFGVPANNIMRTINAIQLHARDIANGEFLSFEAGVERNSKHHVRRIVETMASGNTDVAKGLFEEAVEELALRKAKDGEVTEDDIKDAKSDLKTALGNKYKEGEVDLATATEILSEIFGMSEDDIYWLFDKWDYAVDNGSTEGYVKYDDFFVAVETGKNLKAVIQVYLDNGVEAKTLASQITSHYKPLYKEMTNAERASLKGYLLNAYALLGYKRSDKTKDIDNWLKD